QHPVRFGAATAPAALVPSSGPIAPKTLSIVKTLSPTDSYRRVQFRPPPPLLKGLDSKVNGLIGAFERRPKILESLRRDAEMVDAIAPEWVELEDHQLH